MGPGEAVRLDRIHSPLFYLSVMLIPAIPPLSAEAHPFSKAPSGPGPEWPSATCCGCIFRALQGHAHTLV